MKNKFHLQFLTLMISIGKVLGLAVLCSGIACAVVWPLWKWATASPASYTAVVLGAAAVAASVAIIRTVHRTPVSKVLSSIAYFIVIAGGCAAAIALVFRGHRIAAVAALIVIPVLCAACSAFFSRRTGPAEQIRRTH